MSAKMSLRLTGRFASHALGDGVATARLRRWSSLSPAARRRLLSGLASSDRGRLDRTLTRLGTSRRASDRRILALIGRSTPAPEALGKLDRLLVDADQGVARETRRTFELLAGAAGCLRSEQRKALLAALFSAISRVDDPDARREIASWIVHVGPEAPAALSPLLAAADEADLMAIRGALRRVGGPLGSVLALRWLAHLPIRPAATAALGDAFDPALLSVSHLLLHPERTRASRRAIDRARPLTTPGAISELPGEKRIDALRWRRVVRPARTARTEELRVALTDPSPPARLAAVAHCIRANHQPAELADFAFDSSRAVARLATLTLNDTDRRHRQALDRLVRSEHPPCRGVAGAHQRARDRQTNLQWRQRLEDAPDLVFAEIRGALRSGDVQRRISALRLIERLALVDRFADAVLDAAVASEPRVAATGALLSASLRSPRARVVLGASVGHADPRVRANAIEGAARQEPAGPVVLGALHDDVARVRANAVRAFLLHDREAVIASDALDAMLGDDRPSHRLSALWVAERTAAINVAESVARIASREPDPVVRRRAQRCARRLLAEMRSAGAVDTDAARSE